MIIFGKQARLLKEENANLKARIESLTKRAEKAEQNLRVVNADYEKDIKEFRGLVAGRDNTINQLKVEKDKLKAQLAKLTPCRGKNGRFTHKSNCSDVH